MRTTLKRGMGRGAALTGNGRPVLPPGSLSTVTVYRQPEPERRTGMATVRRIMLWTLVVALMVAGSVGGGAYLWFHEQVAAVSAKTPDVRVAAQRLDVALPGQPAIALVVGYDRRANEADTTPARSDTIMLVRADPRTKSISLLSFPRDMRVEVRCPGRATYVGRINEPYSLCGPAGTVETVRALTGLPVNYLVTVNFRGFRQVVDKLGGVWLDVDRRYLNTRGGPGGFATINLQPGYQKLDGYRALDFVRYRHTDSDLTRVARQQLFVRALKDRIKSDFSYTRLPQVVNTITDNVEVARGGGGDIDGGTVLSYALFAYGLPPGRFFQSKIDGLEGYSELTTGSDNIRKAVAEFSNPDVQSPQKATAVALGIKPKAAAPAARDTTITVLNGNGVAGAASNGGYVLAQRGYSIVTGPDANAPSYGFFRSKIYFDRRQAGAKLAAQKVANLIGSADLGWIPPAIEPLSNGAMLVVVVGRTFQGNLAAAPIDQTPKKQAPNVVPGAAASLAFVRERTKKVPFPLMVPTVIERNSWIDREKPARLYRIDEQGKYKALRLTFRTGGGEYWGIEQTDWAEAPILAERNFVRRLSGRRYELYYAGPKLHMVVLRTPRASYWVINTLLDTLSNDTMLAIAKGLKPSASLK